MVNMKVWLRFKTCTEKGTHKMGAKKAASAWGKTINQTGSRNKKGRTTTWTDLKKGGVGREQRE